MWGAQAAAAPVQQFPADTDPVTAGLMQKPLPHGLQPEGRVKASASRWVSIHNQSATFPTFQGALYDCY